MPRLIAAMALLAGPGLAYLHESGSLGAGSGFGPIVLLTAVAGIALTIGWLSARRGASWLGYLAAVANGLVLALYGFLLVFFGLGGSR